MNKALRNITKKQTRAQRRLWLAAMAPLTKNLRLARMRVGRKDFARWLFNFAYLDLKSLTAGEFTDYGFDILAIMIGKDLGQMDNSELLDAVVKSQLFTLPDKRTEVILRYLPAPSATAEEREQAGKKALEEMARVDKESAAMPPQVSPTLVAQFHHELKQRFDDFFHGRYWKHDEPATTKWLLCPRVRPVQPVSVSFDNPVMNLQPIERLMLIAGRAVQSEIEKFGVCENCKKPFIAIKNPRRKHCSEACSQKLRTMRLKKKQALNAR
jgi:hypothetical protein